MKSIILPAGTEHFQFGELAHLIAMALHPFGDNATDTEMMAYGGVRINLDAELLQAVKDGTLPVKDPLTLGPHTFPVGDALRCSRVMLDDLREFVGGRGLSILFKFTDYEAGAISTSIMTQAERDKELEQKRERQAFGYYTMSEVTQILADTYSLDAAALRKKMTADYYAGNLTVRSRDTETPVLQNHILRTFYDWMFPDDIRAMLVHWKWSREFPFSAIDKVPSQTATDAIKPPEQTQPQPLPTNTIAQLFGGITFEQDRWPSNLSAAKWLAEAKRGIGEQGGASATWCPLTIAQLVYGHEKDARAKQKTLNSLNSRFRNNPVLKPWKDAWDDYYGMFTEPGEA